MRKLALALAFGLTLLAAAPLPAAPAVAAGPAVTCDETVAAALLSQEAWLWVIWFDNPPVFEAQLAQRRGGWEAMARATCV